MKPFVQLVLLLLAIAVVLWIPSGTATDGPHNARFDYSGGSIATGIIDATCDGAAVLHPPGQPGMISFSSRGGRIEHYVTDAQGAIIRPDRDNPYQVPLGATQDSRNETLPAGQGTITWNATGRAAAFGKGWNDEGQPGEPTRFHVQFDTTNLTTSAVSSSIDPNSYLVGAQGGLAIRQVGGAWGWNRFAQTNDGTTIVNGNVTIYLESTQIKIGSTYRHQQPPHRENVTKVDGGEAVVLQVRYYHSIARLVDATIHYEGPSPPLACGQMQMDLFGTFVAYKSRGSYEVEGQRSDFDQKEFTVSGDLTVRETPVELERRSGVPGRMSAQAQGSFSSVGLDFLPQALPAVAELPFSRMALWTTISAAGLALLWKASIPLFTRLEKSRLADHADRARLLDTVNANPGATVAQLTRITAMPRSRIRYHTRVLRAQGVLSVQHGDRDTRLFLPSGLAGNDEALAAYRAKPLSQSILHQLAGSPIRQADLIQEVTRQRRVSKVGIWKSLRTLASSGRIILHRQGREVWVRAAPKP